MKLGLLIAILQGVSGKAGGFLKRINWFLASSLLLTLSVAILAILTFWGLDGGRFFFYASLATSLAFIPQLAPSVKKVYRIPGLALPLLIVIWIVYQVVMFFPSIARLAGLEPEALSIIASQPLGLGMVGLGVALFALGLNLYLRKTDARLLILDNILFLLLSTNYNLGLVIIFGCFALAITVIYLWVQENYSNAPGEVWRRFLFGTLLFSSAYSILSNFMNTFSESLTAGTLLPSNSLLNFISGVLIYLFWFFSRKLSREIDRQRIPFAIRALIMLVLTIIIARLFPNFIQFNFAFITLVVLESPRQYSRYVKASLLGYMAGYLIVQLLLQPSQALTYLYFVPGIMPEFSFEYNYYLFGVAAIVLFELGPLVMLWTKPKDTWQAIQMTAFSGLIVGIFLFAYLAAPAASVAAQRSLYGAAYAPQELQQILEHTLFKPIGTLSRVYTLADYHNIVAPLSEAVLYSFPLILAALGISLLMGVIPVILTGLLVPLKKRPQTESNRSTLYILWVITNNIILYIITTTAAMATMEELIIKVTIQVGLQYWWQPGWIIIPSISFMLIAIAVIALWGIQSANHMKKSSFSALLTGLLALSFLIFALVIWLIDQNLGLIALVFVGIGIEFFRLAQEKWEFPTSSDDEYVLFRRNWFGDAFQAGVIGSVFGLPLLAISLGLVLIAVVAIAPLTSITAPLGKEWLFKLISDYLAISATLVFSSTLLSVLGNLLLAFVFQNIFPWLVDPVWFGKLAGIYAKYRSYTNRLMGGWQKYTKFIYATLFLVALGLLLRNWIILSALAAYIYFVLEPKRFGLLGNRGNVLAGLAASAGLILFLFQENSFLLSLAGLLLGSSFAILFRSLRVYTPNRFRFGVILLFFVGLWGLMSFVEKYQLPVQKLESGIARFKDQRWDIFNEKISPLQPDRNYSFFEGLDGEIWASSYTGPDFVYQDNTWHDVRLWAEILLNETVKEGMFLAPGKMIFENRNYWYWGSQSLSRISLNQDQYELGIPSQPGTINPGQNLASNPEEPDGFVLNQTCLSLIDKTSQCPAFGKISDLVGDLKGGFWVGTEQKGLWHLKIGPDISNSSWEALTTDNSRILSNHIKRVVRDENGNIWAIGDLGVSCLLASGQIRNFPWSEIGLAGNPQSAYVDRLGRIWIGTSENIALWNGQAWAILKPKKITTTYAFFEDSRGAIWALTDLGAMLNQGLSWSDPIDIPPDPLWENPFGFQPFYHLEPYETGIRVMAEDASGNLWLGGPRGLLQFNPLTAEKIIFYPSNSGLPSEYVRDLLIAEDGGIWISTYTVNTARQSELPVLAFGLVFVTVIFFVANFGYQQSPQKNASQLYRALLQQPGQLLSKLYGLAAENKDYPEIQDYLARYLADDPEASTLVRAYGQLGPTEDVAEYIRRLSAVLEERQEDLDARALAFIYHDLSLALQARSVPEIAQWDFKVIGSQNGRPPLMLVAGEPPVEFPAWLDARVSEVLKGMEQTAEYLRKYLQVDSAQDQVVYIADALRALELARGAARIALPPERDLLGSVLEIWREKVNRELNLMSGHAEIRIEFRTRQVRRAEQMLIMLSLKNVGRALAEKIALTVAPDENYQILPESGLALEQLSAGEQVNLEWFIQVPAAKEIRLAGTISWNDRAEVENQVQFADVVKFFETTERFEPIYPNPFEVGKPIKKATLFYGREDIFEFIVQNLRSTTQSRTLVLYGQRRTGKTSILYQLLDGRLGDGFIPVLVDMQELALSINSTADLFIEIADKMARALKKAGLSLTPLDEAGLTSAPARVFNRFLDDLEVSLGNQKVVLMIDEFEILEEKITQKKLEADVLAYMRSLIQHRDHLAFIFTGTHKLEQMSQDYWSIFFNIAIHKQVSFMEPGETEKLIRGPVQGKLGVDDLTVEKMITLTSCHPYFVQLLCYKLVDFCNKQERNYATVSDLNQVVNDLVLEGENYFTYLWKMVTPDQQAVLAAIAEILAPGKNTASLSEILELLISAGVKRIGKNELIPLLDSLTNQEILCLHTGGAMQYSYKVGLIAEWIKKAKPLRILVERGL